MNPQYVIIHHSLTKDGTVADWEAIRRYHKETNGWTDIGYHYGIERVGKGILLQVGRPKLAETRGLEWEHNFLIRGTGCIKEGKLYNARISSLYITDFHRLCDRGSAHWS